MSFLDFQHYFNHSRNQQLIVTVNITQSDSIKAFITELIDEKNSYPFECQLCKGFEVEGTLTKFSMVFKRKKIKKAFRYNVNMRRLVFNMKCIIFLSKL